MSGETFDYRDRILKDEITPSLRAEKEEDDFLGYIDDSLPLSANLTADLCDALSSALHDLDWHYASDTIQNDFELCKNIKQKFADVLKRHSNQ